MASPNRAGEDIAIRRRRLQYRAAHRGTRELDLLLGPFASAEAERMTAAELGRFEEFLDEADTDLQSWLLGQTPPADRHLDLIARILDFKRQTTR